MALTSREKEVLRLNAQGLRQEEIASKLSISQPAVSGFFNKANMKIRKASETLDNSDALGFLTPREREVLELKNRGLRQEDIAKQLDISQPAVSGFYNKANMKLERAKAVVRFAKEVIRNG